MPFARGAKCLSPSNKTLPAMTATTVGEAFLFRIPPGREKRRTSMLLRSRSSRSLGHRFYRAALAHKLNRAHVEHRIARAVEIDRAASSTKFS